jgi:xylulokinase
MNDMISSNKSMEKDIFFYPFLSGECTPFKYDNAKGCFFGIGLDTISSDIVRSVLEGICFQIKANIQAMERPEERPSEFRVFGGGAESDVWCSMMSDITNRNVTTLPTHETAGIGACMLAAVGSKEVSLADCRLKGNKRFEPDKANQELYEKKYTRYIKMQEKIMKKEEC